MPQDQPSWVDVVNAACKSIGQGSHAALARDVLHDGGGWLPREDAIAFARRLLLDAGDEATAAMLAAERERGRQDGFEQGWAAALKASRLLGPWVRLVGRIAARARFGRNLRCGRPAGKGNLAQVQP